MGGYINTRVKGGNLAYYISNPPIKGDYLK